MTLEQKNCGAWCSICRIQNTHYTILDGSYVYTCLSCKRTGSGWKRIKVVEKEYPLFTFIKPTKIRIV